jgi:hypothetical protein
MAGSSRSRKRKTSADQSKGARSDRNVPLYILPMRERHKEEKAAKAGREPRKIVMLASWDPSP